MALLLASFPTIAGHNFARRPATGGSRTARRADCSAQLWNGYRAHLEQHITPIVGSIKLAKLTPATIREFANAMRLGKHGKPRSPDMVRRVLVSLGSLLAFAHEHGHVSQNALHGVHARAVVGHGKSCRSVSTFRRPMKSGRWLARSRAATGRCCSPSPSAA